MSELYIRELETSDYDALATFNSAFPGDNLSAAQWLARLKHWWDDNPSYIDEWKRGFLLLNVDQIVGFVGSFPTNYKAGDEVIRAFNGTTWRVLEAYRNWSIDLWTKNREVSKNFLSFNTTPTDDIIKLIKRFKYLKYPWGDDTTSYHVSRPFLFSRCFLPATIQILFVPAGIALYMLQTFKTKQYKSDYKVKEISNTEDIDRLWQRTKNQVAYTNERSSRCVDWYASGKNLAGLYCNDELTAYAIFSIQKHALHPFKEMILTDFWYDRDKNLLPQLSALHEYAKKMAAEHIVTLIKYPHFSKEISEILIKLGFRTKPQTSRGYLRLGNDQSFTINGGNSYFTLTQGDYGV